MAGTTRSTEVEMELAVDLPRFRIAPMEAKAPELDPSDEALLERVASSDREAFEILYHRYVRPVFGLALRKLGDRGQAEEVTQEAFASVWRSAESYRPERGSAGGWIYTVARNATVDRMRRNGRIDTSAELPELESPEGEPSEHAERADAAWRVHRALEELNENEREVIQLAYWSGLSQSEVAAYLGQPLGTVKTRTRSALARLAEVLEGDAR
jgi:RNA polymerase sigma-70 factor (ECF subfamily)